MKKLLLLFVLIVGFKSFASASSFKLDNAVMEQKFAASEEIQINEAFTLLLANADSYAKGSSEKNKVVAGVLGIVCGWAGLHRFYLGHTKAGLIYLGYSLCSGGIIAIITTVTLGVGGILAPLASLAWLLGVIDGVMYIIADDSEFNSKYASNPRLLQWIKTGTKLDSK